MRSVAYAIEMVFGSAAALSTCFCTRNGYMLDYVRLEEVQTELLNLYSKSTRGDLNGEDGSLAGLCHAGVSNAMSKSLSTLLDDLYSHVKLVGM